MLLVAYSDSEGSENEDISKPVPKPVAKPAAPTAFAVDKANPKKIRINLTETVTHEREDVEPASKKPRVGAGVFSGFNAMLPAPKRDNLHAPTTNGSKAPARKVFSLKTGAEPAFSRDSDSELRDLFSEQGTEQEEGDAASTIPANIPKPAFITEPESDAVLTKGKPLMFKPLSVSRSTKKKKPTSHMLPAPSQPVEITAAAAKLQQAPETSDAPKKISLFSSGPTELPPDPANDEEDEIVEILDDDTQSYNEHAVPSSDYAPTQPESLQDIASSLNLSAAERRQLLGRHGTTASNKIISFNTDAEWASNQAHIAAGEQIQHNPVRGIAPGKHSLKSLVASAQGQKDALEETFARGRTNKKEAGSRYGW